MRAIGNRLAAAVLLVAMAACLPPCASLAKAHSSYGCIDGWTPHGNAPKSGKTKFGLVDWNGKTTKFVASNRSSKYYWQGTSGGYSRVSRNRFFKYMRKYESQSPGLAVSKWKWKRNSKKHKYRYAMVLRGSMQAN